MKKFALITRDEKEYPLTVSEVKTVPTAEEAIEEAAQRAKRMVTKRALFSAGFSVLPIPGVDIAVDIGVMASILNSINMEFGLTPKQIERLPTEDRLKLFSVITMAGSAFAGKVITKALLTAALSKIGIQLTAAQASKWVPIVGSAVSAGVSFTALKYVGNQHIADCMRIASELAQWKRTVRQEVPRGLGPKV